ncbi:GNAT family N-acetyltransferase [Sulfobacillus sp. DSM 109850]|uniref:GNAT family N-acetyltransferase n=2 Tax=Sulfobacillus harzensis TaxID=2729629 RepID=A0A7Y0Q437_9FIRM|nr:GNAT family N-acetyltransferase [Sulfobacillus harzensis]
MTETEYQAFLADAVKEYAGDHVRGGRWSQDEALEESAKEFAQLLPEGPKTPDHYLFTVVDGDHNRPVGTLWYMVRPGPNGKTAFIYNIRMNEDARGQGYGTQTLKALEADAQARGVVSMSLHVFGHNEGAFRLYQRLGYRTTNIVMAKDLK